MNLQGRIEKRVSKKGNDYEVLIITFQNGYEKAVFLDNAEKFLVKQNIEKK